MPPSHEPLSHADVLKVARLARLELSNEQADGLRGRLGVVLDYVQRLQSLDLEGVEPLAHVGEEPQRPRPDEPGPMLSPDRLMQMAPESLPPFVRIPKVLGDGGGA